MPDFDSAYLCRHSDCVDDPRGHNIRHNLYDILMITLCAVISGADSWVMIQEYGRSKKDWLHGFLELPNGIPSHDTFARVLALLSPDSLREFYGSWIADITGNLEGRTVSIDGKTNRGSRNKADGKNPIHMVSAWCSSYNLVLGQIKTEEKSNEITAIPELIRSLSLEGTIITIDAMGCQKRIAQEIIDAKANYIFQVKDNHKQLREDIALFFEDVSNGPFEEYETIDGDHGRIETRRYHVCDDVEWLAGGEEWRGLKTLVMVYRKREIGDQISQEKSFYISSLELNAQKIGKAIRGHWSIENSLHWCLDVSFGEDASRIRKDHAPENMTILRHLALAMIKNDKTTKGSVKTRRMKAAWDNSYMEKVLFG